MLFSLHPETQPCKSFEKLNAELLHFLESSVEAVEFGPHLFTAEVGAVCLSNGPTIEKFHELWIELRNLSHASRGQISRSINSLQSVQDFFSNRELEFTQIDETKVVEKLKRLTSHLYSETKGLEDLRACCDDENIDTHFEHYRNTNGNICKFCGTEILAQQRTELPEGVAQWRCDYDHLLSKNSYPLYGVHPGNLFPMCRTCNQKAKGSKEVLKKDGNRRLGFYPSDPEEESAHGLIGVEIRDDDGTPDISIHWANADDDSTQKLEAWDEVFQIRSRVKGRLASIVEWLDAHLKPRDLEDLREQIDRHSQPQRVELQNEEWIFWRSKLYNWLNNEGARFCERLWDMIQQTRDDSSNAEMFGV